MEDYIKGPAEFAAAVAARPELYFELVQALARRAGADR